MKAIEVAICFVITLVLYVLGCLQLMGKGPLGSDELRSVCNMYGGSLPGGPCLRLSLYVHIDALKCVCRDCAGTLWLLKS